MKMRDVFVTDHSPKDRQAHTNSESEDEKYFKYMQSVEAYNAKSTFKPTQSGKARYPKGSFMQRLVDPFADAERLPSGTLFKKFE